MKELTSKEMKNIKGGASVLATTIGVSALIAFLVGVISGLTNPEHVKGVINRNEEFNKRRIKENKRWEY